MTTPVTGTSDNSVLQNYLAQQAKNIAADKTTATANAANTGASSTLTGIGSNFTTFLKILTTQLQHQDPTSATDPNQFTQELVQFAGVEQQINTNSNLQALLNLQKNSSGATAALGYIDRYVEVPASGKLAVQDGKAEIGYNLANAAQKAAITVRDANGTTVAILDGSTQVGMNYFTWDGKDSSGTQMPDGTYSFVLAVTNTDGSAQTVTDQRVIGKVTGISSNSDGTTNLSIDDITAATSKVNAVYTPGNLPASTKSTT